MKRVYLLRHAKSSWSEEGMKDHDRPLNARGRGAAQRMGAEMKFRDYIPDVILCSSAKRTQETLSLMAPAMGADIPARIDADLYLAGTDVLLERIRGTSADADSIMLVGHNPGLEQMIVELTNPKTTSHPCPDKLPAGALVVVDFDVESWGDVAPRTGDIADLIFPKLLPA